MMLSWIRCTLFKWIVLLTPLALAGCASSDMTQYANEKPRLDLAQYFGGQTTGWGMVQDRFGNITRRFVVQIEGRFEGDQGTLDEKFEWSDGEKQQRIWRLKKVGNNQWSGQADDVIGQATGDISGNVLRWQYTLAVPVKGTTLHMQFDDVMVLIDEQVMLNRAVFSKWGIRLGEVSLSFRKSGQNP
jgi:uncharacterized protein YjbJ (UPF0337 family)